MPGRRLSGVRPPLTLRAVRESAKLTQMDLARLSGVSQGLISQLELGTVKNPKMETIDKLATALDIGVAAAIKAIRASGDTAA